jgi:hypothetical protein
MTDDPTTSTRWHITVMSRDGKRVAFHAAVESLKEIQALATEARHRSLSVKIWIRPPNGKVYSWD